MRGGNISAEKLNIKSYISFQKSEDKGEDKLLPKRKPPINILKSETTKNNNINILPAVKINEPRIRNKKIELNYNQVNSLNNIKNKIELKKPILVHSGSQRLIKNIPNNKQININLNLNLNSPKKVLQKNGSSELPSLNIISHINDIYKIYAPYLKRPEVQNNIRYKPYNNNNNRYLKNIHRYYKIDKQNNNIGRNIYNVNSIKNVMPNRLGSGRKVLPNRKLSPLKRSIINIS